MSTLPITILPLPLSKENFGPFGDVIDAQLHQGISINQGTTERFHDLARLDTTRANGRAGFSIFKAKSRPWPIHLEVMERHPLGSQAFYPLGVENMQMEGRWLVVVAKADCQNPLDPTNLCAFIAHINQGVNYAPGVWHHPLLVLESHHNFVVVDRIGKGHNLDECWFEEPVVIQHFVS